MVLTADSTHLQAEAPMPSQIHHSQQTQYATPAAQVFSTVELLEMILLEVCENDLTTAFLSRRVNSTFKAIIEGSMSLQRALFLRCDIPHPEIEDETGIRINPTFDCTGIVEARRYIEAYDFGTSYRGGYGPGTVIPVLYDESVDVWCEDAILSLCEGPLLDMVLLERRTGDRFRVGVEFYFRLRKEGYELPEAVRVPIRFGEWKQITVGQVVEKAREKLGEWYPEHYGSLCGAGVGVNVDVQPS